MELVVTFAVVTSLALVYTVACMANTERQSFASFELERLPVEEEEEGESFYWLRVSQVNGNREHRWNLSELFSSGRVQLERSSKIVTIFRWKIWWVIPRTIDEVGEVPPETYLILAPCAQRGKYVSIITISDFTFEGDASSLAINGHIREFARPLAAHRAALLSFGNDPLELTAKAMKILKGHLRERAGVPASPPSPAPPSRSSIADVEVSRPGSSQPRLAGSASTGNLQPSRADAARASSIADLFGWCTWDSFYTDLSENKVMSGLESFISTGVRPRVMILDDGWQRTDVDHVHNGKQWGGRLSSFHANFKFSDSYGNEVEEGTVVVEEGIIEAARTYVPGEDSHEGADFSLKNIVANAKANHSIDKFLVWHTLTGYWGGVSVEPSSKMTHLRPELKFPHLTASVKRMSVAQALHSEPFTKGGVGLVHVDHAQDFFQQYHETLKTMGVDGVKVDAQSVLPLLEDERAEGKDIALAFHRGLRTSVHSNFGKSMTNEVPIIHCMAHSQGTLLSIAALYTDEDVPIIRGSDDFWPTDASSHGPHVYANAMNSLLMSHLGVHDWDMWQSDLGAPSMLHAASRAISGGPVYVSDKPNRQNASLLRQVSMPDGSVPRPARNCRPAAATLFLDPQRTAGVPLVLQNANPSRGLVVGVFNIAGSVLENDKDLFRSLSPAEITWPAGADVNVHKIDGNKYEEYLGIHWAVGPHDVEEWRQRAPTTTEYLAYRFSDKAMFLLSPEKGNNNVHVSLPKVFDVDIISFAPLLSLASASTLPASRSGLWVSFLGATQMLNPGGAVLSLTCEEEKPEEGTLVLSAELLGEGLYQMIVCPECTVQILQTQVLSGATLISDVTCESSLSTAVTGVGGEGEVESKVSVQVVDIKYSSTGQRETGSSDEGDIRLRVALKLLISK